MNAEQLSSKTSNQADTRFVPEIVCCKNLEDYTFWAILKSHGAPIKKIFIKAPVAAHITSNCVSDWHKKVKSGEYPQPELKFTRDTYWNLEEVIKVHEERFSGDQDNRPMLA